MAKKPMMNRKKVYYAITRTMEVEGYPYFADSLDESLAACGNMFATRKQAEGVLKKFQAILRLHRHTT